MSWKNLSHDRIFYALNSQVSAVNETEVNSVKGLPCFPDQPAAVVTLLPTFLERKTLLVQGTQLQVDVLLKSFGL